MKTSFSTSSKNVFVRNALASVRIEGLRVSGRFERELDAYAQDKKTIFEIIQSTKKRYGAM